MVTSTVTVVAAQVRTKLGAAEVQRRPEPGGRVPQLSRPVAAPVEHTLLLSSLGQSLYKRIPFAREAIKEMVARANEASEGGGPLTLAQWFESPHCPADLDVVCFCGDLDVPCNEPLVMTLASEL